ncbi:MAG: hypothetical protein Q4F54_05135 [Coriobacteriia bacterium]|nr:hypothetical protein [Coriobacteriia bacterium]
MSSLVEDNNTIVASWVEAITVPLYSKYPKLLNFSDSQTQFQLSSLQNISIKWRGTSDWIVLTMYDGSEKAYQMGSSDHAYAYELNIYYHDTNANLCQAHVTETTDFLSAVGAVTVQDVASDFVRFDLDSYLYDYYRQNGSHIYADGGYPISKTNDLVDSSCQGTALVYNGETECAHFYVDMQNKLHIEDPVTGFSEIYYVDNPGEGNTVN